MKIIKWENKYSHEIGYVGSVEKAEGHFVNAADEGSANTYRNQAAADKAVKDLMDMGEGNNNVFTVVDAPVAEKAPKTAKPARTRNSRTTRKSK